MIVTLDFETYHDKDYTLKKLSTSEYVRDERFEAISCAVKLDSGPTRVYFGKDEISKALAKINWSKVTLLCHHTQFDGLILSHHFGVVPSRYADTLSMARALHPKTGKNDLASVTERYPQVKHKKLEMPEFKGKHLTDLTPEEIEQVRVYNAADVDATHDVYEAMLPLFPEAELDLIDVIIRMFADPVLVVDVKLAQRELRREKRAKGRAIRESGVAVDRLLSDKKFVAELERLGVEVPMKMSKPGKKNPEPRPIPAIAKSDEALQALLHYPDEAVVKLVRGRLAAKSTIGESRAERMLLRAGKTGKWRLPIYYNFSGAHTHRLSGGDSFNPQNFKQSQKEGGELRKAITAPPGFVLIVVDASQIEARITAWLAGESWVVEAFREGRDLYSEFATKAYGRLITKLDKEERFVGKTCVLGLGFQMGGPKLQITLLTQSINQGLDPVRMELPICYRLVNTYRSECPNITRLWSFLNDRGISAMMTLQDGEEWDGLHPLVFEEGAIRLPNGLRLHYPGLKANIVPKARNKMFAGGQTEDGVHDASYLTYKGRTKLYGGLLTENIVQALARIIVLNVMLQLSKKYRIVMTTHDEIVFLAPKVKGIPVSGDHKSAKIHPALTEAMQLMATPPEWGPDLPLASEGGWDVSYSK